MRILFVVLFCMNLLLFAAIFFPSTQDIDPMRGHEPINANKIKLVPPPK